MNTHICIDGRSLMEPRWGGVSHYTNEMAQAIARDDRGRHHAITIFLSGRKKNSRVFKQHTALSSGELFAIRHCALPNILLNAITLGVHAPCIDTLAFPHNNADITWLPNWNIVSTAGQYVLTVHDLSIFHYPQSYSLKERLWHKAINISKLILNARHIIAVSEYTANDIEQVFHLPRNRITVIYEGVHEHFFDIPSAERKKEVQEKYHLPDKFILGFWGSARKNQLLLKTIKHHVPFPLICVGTSDLPYIEEYDKPIVYSIAWCMVYPSFFEGFGLPLLEAMASGTPVITSNVTSIPEVVRDAGLLISPFQHNQWINVINELSHDDGLRNELIEKGRARAKELSWSRAGKEWWKCIEKVI